MKTATVTHFRQKMREHLNELESNQDILILSGAKQKDFVVITLKQFNAMEETSHLLSTPANTAHLLESIKQDQAEKFSVKNLDLDDKKRKVKSGLSPKRSGLPKSKLI